MPSDLQPRPYDRDRFERLALYVAKRSSNDPKFGKTKLAKILYYSDSIAYTDLGDAITGADYAKLPKGPYPRGLDSALKRIGKSGRGHVVESDYFGQKQKRLVALEHVNIDDFTAEEISLVDQVIEAFRDDNAATVSDFSHEYSAWVYAADLKEIPYDLAWVGTGDPPEDVLAIGQDAAGRLGILSA